MRKLFAKRSLALIIPSFQSVPFLLAKNRQSDLDIHTVERLMVERTEVKNNVILRKIGLNIKLLNI